MRKLVVGTFVTLDAVMQAPGGPDEDRESAYSTVAGSYPISTRNFAKLKAEDGGVPRALRLDETRQTATGAVLKPVRRP